MTTLDFTRAIGIDEAGRGCLAGDVYAAAVLLPPNFAAIDDVGLNDSKKLTPKKRERLHKLITEHARCGIGIASVAEIEQLNILRAAMLAMRRAHENLLSHGYIDGDVVAYVDGNQSPGITDRECRTIIGGDGMFACIAAASIVAKVERDMYMNALAVKYPGYGFEQHKGYGTKAHFAALLKLGRTPAHRPSFLH